MSAVPPPDQMPTGPVSAIVLAAGMGTRMKSDLPKVMHRLAGLPMIKHVTSMLETAGAERIVVVTAPGMDDVADTVQPHQTAIQTPALGTGHAVAAAREALGEVEGTVLVVFGADPTLRPETVRAMIERREANDDPAVVVLGFRTADPALYGRLIADDTGALSAIVEARDATPEQLEINLCNGGAMAISAKHLWPLIDAIGNENAKNEYYLTDIVAIARNAGCGCAVVEAPEGEFIGVDSRADLADAEALIQQRLRKRALDGGATLIDPASVFLSADTQIGRDVVIEPNVFIGPGVTIGDRVTVHAFCHLEKTSIGADTSVGPFARLRGNAEIGAGARIGNFVEMKNVTFGDGAKASHLAYVGDSTVGEKANIGAGTITCNYNGFQKSRTEIGAGAFIGSNTALVAPVKVGKGAIVGAGSTVTKDVGDDDLAVTRAEQRNVTKGAARYRARQKDT